MNRRKFLENIVKGGLGLLVVGCRKEPELPSPFAFGPDPVLVEEVVQFEGMIGENKYARLISEIYVPEDQEDLPENESVNSVLEIITPDKYTKYFERNGDGKLDKICWHTTHRNKPGTPLEDYLPDKPGQRADFCAWEDHRPNTLKAKAREYTKLMDRVYALREQQNKDVN